MDIKALIADCVFGEAYCQSLYDLMTKLNFENALEIGFDSGSSALMLLAAKPDAILTSVDIRELPDAEALVAKHGFKDRHAVITGDSAEIMKNLFEEGMSYDYIYVDGDHLYNAVRMDLDWAAKLLEKNGTLVIDDCVQGHGVFGVYEATEDFMNAQKAKGITWTKQMIPGNPHLACFLVRS